MATASEGNAQTLSPPLGRLPHTRRWRWRPAAGAVATEGADALGAPRLGAAPRRSRAQYSRAARNTDTIPYTPAPMSSIHPSAPRPPEAHIRDVATSAIAITPIDR